jgi:hypothetical protein
MLELERGRLGTARRVVDLDRGDRTPGLEHASRLAQDLDRIGDVLEEPHHPDVVERTILERKRQGVGIHQRRLDAGPLEVAAGEVELLRFDVDSREDDPRKLLAEDSEHRTDAAPDLEQPRARRKRSAVGDQPVTPVLRLLDESLVLARPVAVDVVGHPWWSNDARGRDVPRR